MKGVILAGGTGQRLMPLTKCMNKHLLPVGREPMICHPVRKLTEAGITEILVVTGTEHMGAVVGLLGSGSEYSCRFTYKVQDKPGGIAQALALAESFVDGKFVVLLGDNIFEKSLAHLVNYYRWSNKGAMILLNKVEKPQRFGVPVFYGKPDEFKGLNLKKIEEKPKRPKSAYAVTGIYFYWTDVFGYIRDLKPSKRGELEITDVNNAYIRDEGLEYKMLAGWWTDAGTHESLRQANELVNGESK